MEEMFEPFESMVSRAEYAIKRFKGNAKEKAWLIDLLGILKRGNHASICDTEGVLWEVIAIAYTNGYASFFDVFNHIKMFDLDVQPTIVLKK